MSGVQAPPAELTGDMLAAVLSRRWQLAVTSLDYLPVGFGSHHWSAEADGRRWFVTADDLAVRRHAAGEPAGRALARLRAALAAARDLRDCGVSTVLPPVPARDGELAASADDRFAVAVYPFVTGQSFSWGDFAAPGHRRALLDLVLAVHTAPPAARRRAAADDCAVPHRDELESALAGDGPDPAAGPYSGRTARLLADCAIPVTRCLARYDELAQVTRAQPSRAVLTHGEPHPGNSMLTPDGWLLIDWDTALIGQPERDLWDLDPGDGSILRAYAAATGVTPQAPLLALYRLRWDLADLAAIVSQFGAPHAGSADDEFSFGLLPGVLARLTG